MNKISIILLSLYLAGVIKLMINYIIGYKNTIKNREKWLEEFKRDNYDVNDKSETDFRLAYTILNTLMIIASIIIWPLFFIMWIISIIKDIIKGVNIDE